jgi:hypothetical protein
MIRDHVATICRRYGTRIHSYDVVNEAVHNQTGELRETAFSRAFGGAEPVLDLAFRTAREAAPQAQLVYNDYMSWEPWSANHRAGVLRLLEGFRARSIPVDALGVRPISATANIDSGSGFGERQEQEWRHFLDAVVGMGYDLVITELDVHDKGLPADIAERDRAVAEPRRRLSRPDAELFSTGRHHGVGDERSLFLASGTVAPGGRPPQAAVPLRCGLPAQAAARGDRDIAAERNQPQSSRVSRLLHCAFLLVALLLAPPAFACEGSVAVCPVGSSGAVALVAASRPSAILSDPGDDAGVLRAVANLRTDLRRVAGQATASLDEGPVAIIAGTLGHHTMIDRLVREGRLDVTGVSGQWEAYVHQIVDHPAPGIDRALVIAGADRRGTIFGIYDLSQRVGVSPWHWWADVPVARHADPVRPPRPPGREALRPLSRHLHQ